MIVLPKDKKALGRAVIHIASTAESRLYPRRAEWLLNRAWLQGVRDYSSIDFRLGKIQYNYINEVGKLRFRYEDVLRDLQIEMGRFLQIDIRPSVKQKGTGLDKIRAASIGQVILDNEVTGQDLDRIRQPFFEQLLVYGASGIGSTVTNLSMFGGRSVLEVIPPWQILPIPHNAPSIEAAAGIIRSRVVSLAALRRHSVVGDKIRRYSDQELNARSVDWSRITELERGEDDESSLPLGRSVGSEFRVSLLEPVGGDEKAAKHEEFLKVVRLTEVFLHEPGTTQLSRHIVMVGPVVIIDTDFTEDGVAVYRPFGMARYYPSGFWGRSFVGPVIPFSSRVEKSLETIFQTLEEYDPLGIMGIPTTLGITDRSFRIKGRPRRFFYRPDPLDPRIQPIQIEPRPVGTVVQQAINLSQSIKQNLTGHSPMLQGMATGRADSAAAHGFLLEVSNVSIEAPGSSVAGAFSDVYRAVLASARFRLTRQQQMEIISPDDVGVGVVVNEDGKLDLSLNPIPTPNEVEINIRSRTPPSPTQEVQELKELLQMQIIDPYMFRRHIWRKGLNVPVENEAEHQAWRKARVIIRELFNDGRTPKIEGITVDMEADKVEVILRELEAFMAGPEFAAASPAVKEAFKQYKKNLVSSISQFPDQLPSPEIAAQMAAGGGVVPGGAIPGAPPLG